jgi:hypothetical protein
LEDKPLPFISIARHGEAGEVLREKEAAIIMIG